VKLGALDATAHQGVASRFNIRGYPTIKMFAGGSTKTDASAQDYNGAREAGAIVEAALKFAEASGGGASTSAVTELTSQDVFDEHCSGKRICIIAFLNHILDECVRVHASLFVWWCDNVSTVSLQSRVWSQQEH
jgi:protein disulfide-isomerase A6